jgi:hypothetical protein
MPLLMKRGSLALSLVVLASLLLLGTIAWAADTDLDGVDDAIDNCPSVFNPTQADADADGIGDQCDPDADPDADGLPNSMDNCPNVSNPSQSDYDGDGAGDTCDNCPLIANVDQADVDHDGIGDACEGVSTTGSTWGSLKSWYR